MDVTLSVYSSNIDSILSIYNDSEKTRIEKRKELEDKLERDKKWSTEDFENYSHYNFHFEWLLMHSLFITGFSYFENYMRSIAKRVEKKTDSKIKLKDIKGNGFLDCYRKYINLIGEIEYANNENEIWRKILEFKTIRNSLTHHYGRIDKKIKLVEKHNLYYGPSKKQIRISNIDFLKDFCKSSIDYMTEISLEVKGKNYSS